MNSRNYLTTGRVNQKRRTREALLEVAAELIRQGRTFSIGDVADIAKVGRTTAYRYYPTVDLLIANAALWKVAGREQNEFEDQFGSDSTPYEKVDSVVIESDRSTHEHRNEFRAMLRVSLDQGVKDAERRSQIRYFLLKKTLADLQLTLGDKNFEQLVCALSLTVGIESQIVLQDICMLPPNKAREVKRWAAQALLKAALAEAQDESVEKITKVRKKRAQQKNR